MGRTKKHIILDHLAKSKGLRRKDLVTFICKLNGYDGHKQGYYGTNIQGWAEDGYIIKKGKKWYIGNIGKLYLKNPKQATPKSTIYKLSKQVENWKKAYRDECNVSNHYRVEYSKACDVADHFRMEYKEAMETLDNERNTRAFEEELRKVNVIPPNTLVKMPPPSTDYSEFTKAELEAEVGAIITAMVKAML